MYFGSGEVFLRSNVCKSSSDDSYTAVLQLYYAAAKRNGGALATAMDAYGRLPRAATPEDVGMSSVRLQRAVRSARKHVDAGDHPNHALIVSRCGKIVLEDTYGLADVAGGQPLRPDAIFRWASMTKPVTCAAAMICYEMGHFLLDDPLEMYLPEFAETLVLAAGDADSPQLAGQKEKVTIKHLLTHTSGICAAGLGRSEAGRMQARVLKAAGPPADLAAHCTALAASPLIAQPGTLWHYGSGLTVLGRCIEVWSGMTFDTFLEEYLCAPLGMVDCGFKIPPAKLHRLCEAYRFNGPHQMELLPTAKDGGSWTSRGGVFDGSGGLCGTIADYFLFAQVNTAAPRVPTSACNPTAVRNSDRRVVQDS